MYNMLAKNTNRSLTIPAPAYIVQANKNRKPGTSLHVCTYCSSRHREGNKYEYRDHEKASA